MRVLTRQPTIRPFEADDLLVVLNRDGCQVPHETVVQQAAGGPAWTAVIDGQPAGCGGLVLPWPGIGMCWLVVSDELITYRLWLTRTVGKFLINTIRAYELHRVEAVALDESQRNQDWLELIGFTREEHGRARAFLSDRRTVVRYEWVKED